VELAGRSMRTRALGGKEYFSRRCCRKLSAERSRIEFTTLTLLLESNTFDVQLKAFALDLFTSKNIITKQMFEGPDRWAGRVFFSSLQRR
jgi:hypothetical protein